MDLACLPSMPPTAFRAAYEALLAGEHPWDAGDGERSQRVSEKANAAPRAQYLADILSMPVERATILDLLAGVSPTELLDDRYARRRDNITALWKEALRVWVEGDEALVPHAMDTLEALACALLPKAYTNFTLDVITLLAGRMDEADDVFYALMSAIDRTLRTAPEPQQHCALRLAVVVAAYTSSSSLSTYLLHRDLFAAAMQAMLAASSTMRCEIALLTALLATAGHVHGAARSLDVDVPTAVLSSAIMQPYQRRLRDTQDPTLLAQACSEGLTRMLEAYAPPDHSIWHDWMGHAPSQATLPPPCAWLLLAVWVWLLSNDAFGHAVFETDTPLVVPLLSVASFVLTHAASHARATTYAHTTLQILLGLLGPTDTSTPAHRLLVDEDTLPTPLVERIVQCRDKPGALPLAPHTGTKRPRRLVVPILHNVTLFLTYNRSKRLDVPSFRTALIIVQRVALLCAKHRIQLEYDWLEVWRAILATADFVVARQAQLSRECILALAPCLLETLAIVLVLSDRCLQTPAEIHWLVYELARSRHTLEKLVPMAGAARHTHWALLADMLQCIDTQLAQRDAARSSPSFMTLIPFFRRDQTEEPVSMRSILQIIQRLDLEALLAADKPVCAAITRAAYASSASKRSSVVPSPSATLLRIVQLDWLQS